MMTFIAILILSSALSFYGGSQYAIKNTAAATIATENAQGGLRQGGTRQRNMQGGGSGLVSGKVLSKNDQNIVVELRDGGSKIVFLSPSTEISKFVSGTAADLEIGSNVTISGDTNPDGSLNAKTLQLRPDGLPRFGNPGQATTTPTN